MKTWNHDQAEEIGKQLQNKINLNFNKQQTKNFGIISEYKERRNKKEQKCPNTPFWKQ